MNARVHSFKSCFLLALLLSIAYCLSTGAETDQCLEETSSAADLVVELRKIANDPKRPGGKAVMEQLLLTPEESVSAIGDVLFACNAREQELMCYVLMRIGGESSARLRLELCAHGATDDVRTGALNSIGDRVIAFKLPSDVREGLLTILREDSDGHSGSAAYVLSQCVSEDKEVSAQLVSARFLKAIDSQTELPKLRDSYLSPRVHMLNSYLRAYANLGHDAVAALTSALGNAGTDEERRWLTLALGMSGEGSVSSTIKNMIETEEDVSIRCVAVRAYSSSARDEAIPFLKTLLNDDDVSETASVPGDPVYPVRIVAQGEIHRREQAQKSKKP